MAKHIEVRVTVPLSVDEIVRRAHDVAEVSRVAQASGAEAASVVIDDAGVTTISRVFPAPAPVRAYIGRDDIDVIEQRIWEGQSARIVASITGLRIQVTGTLRLMPQGDATLVVVDATVVADMGFTSGFAESMVAERLSTAMQAEAEALA